MRLTHKFFFCTHRPLSELDAGAASPARKPDHLSYCDIWCILRKIRMIFETLASTVPVPAAALFTSAVL